MNNKIKLQFSINLELVQFQWTKVLFKFTEVDNFIAGSRHN